MHFIEKEIHLDPDVHYQLVSDVENDVTDKNVDPGASGAHYKPHKWKDPHYDWLLDLIKDEVEKTLNKRFRVGPWWFLKCEDEDSTLPHEHSRMADWVAIYYFEAPEGSGPLYFNDHDVYIYPYSGLLVIHEADLVHQAFKNDKPGIKRYNMVVNFWEYNESV